MRVRRRAGSPQALATTLAQSGVSEEQLRLRLRDDLRIEAFLAQRFGSARQPSEQELQAYYQAHQADYALPPAASGPSRMSGMRSARSSPRPSG